MTLDPFKINQENWELVATHIAHILERLNELDRKGVNLDREQELEAAEPGAEHSTRYSDTVFRYYITRVQSVYSDQGYFMGVRTVPSTTSSKWVDHPQLTSAITIDVPPNLSAPSENDIVGMFFSGLYGADLSPRWTMLGASGGTIQCKISIVLDDTLLCYSVVDSVVDNATDIYVAKPTTLRKTGWDGETVNGITYAYSTTGGSYQARSATIAASTGLSIVQVITRAYSPGDIIYAAKVPSTNITAGGPVKYIDLNVDGRQWAAEGVSV